ncbi:MAG: glycosyltransferase [Candidatus Krumholzibacteria bacterium]|nr:glycosyltransferase [Candidatus Krumholzibacteria bacterium]
METLETGDNGGRLPRPLRVCMLIPKLRIGGAEVQVLSLLENLSRERFSVSLCLLSGGDVEMEQEAARWAASVYRLGFRRRNAPLALARLVRYLRMNRFDVVHAHLPPADVLGRIAGRLAGVNVIVTTEHGKHLWKGRPYLLLEHLLDRATDMRICVSRDILDIRMRRERTPRDKLIYIPNAVDIEALAAPVRDRASVAAEFGWRAEDPLIVTVGRLVAAKDYPALVEAIAVLRRTIPDARCLIVGDGDCRGAIEERIEKLDCGEGVKITGYRRDIPDFLGAADVFVLSSIREGLPVSLLEAMAAGRAIVSTSIGGIPDAISDGRNGLLVPSGDRAALAAALERLVRDPALRAALGRAAAADAGTHFGMKNVAGRIGDLYVELCSRKRARSARV